MGTSLSYKSTHVNLKNPKITTTFNFNVEESGLPYGLLKIHDKNSQNGNFFNQYLKDFFKGDIRIHLHN